MTAAVTDMTAAAVTAVAAVEAACFSVPWTEAMLASSRETSGEWLVARRDGEIVGWAGMTVAADEADILRIAVLPSARRAGVASALLRELFARASARGVVRMTLDVRAGNAPAIALYEQHGFVPDGVRPHYYERPTENALLYHKDF